MIDWEEIFRTDSPDSLREAKLWLFQENMRLERERQELSDSMDKFLRERVRLKNELDELNRRTVIERKRLREENLFFDKKMEILQEGFRQLEEDRKSLDCERAKLEWEREQLDTGKVSGLLGETGIAEALFRNTTNPMTLRKRYRDLVKIFHPDNLAGDEELIQLINKEFARRRREE